MTPVPNLPKNEKQIEKEERRKEDENTKNENLQQPDNTTHWLVGVSYHLSS